MKQGDKRIYGIYLNDADYPTQPSVNGKREVCPFYRVWKGMLNRCHCSKVLQDRPNYRTKTVSESWVRFTDFRSWMETQVWEGLHLDKDILDPSSDVYGPNTCAFVPHYLNTILNIRSNDRGPYPLGVTKIRDKRMVKDLAKPFLASGCVRGEGNRYLGIFATEMEAHKAWQENKVKALTLAINNYRTEVCYRSDVDAAISKRIDKLKFEIENNLETKQI